MGIQNNNLLKTANCKIADFLEDGMDEHLKALADNSLQAAIIRFRSPVVSYISTIGFWFEHGQSFLVKFQIQTVSSESSDPNFAQVHFIFMTRIDTDVDLPPIALNVFSCMLDKISNLGMHTTESHCSRRFSYSSIMISEISKSSL
jgi:hypothetical protein